MAKSLRSKREKRLRAIRREIVEPLYETKDAAKLAAQEAALAAPKVPVRLPPSSTTTAAMDLATTNTDSTSAATTFSFNAMGALSLSHTHFDLKLFDQILFFFLGEFIVLKLNDEYPFAEFAEFVNSLCCFSSF